MVAQLQTGTLIGGRFEIESALGTSALGQLYRAVDQKTQKPVVVRMLDEEIASDARTMDALRERIRSASGLAHKNIARVFGLGKEGSQRYIAAEFVDGQSLQQLVKRKRSTGKTFSYKGAYNVIAHVCNALTEAHPALPHGLPGPSSILINKAGRVKVCDFGVVPALHPESGVFQRLGDAYALAPELHLDPGGATPSADIYTVGVVLHELLTGETPGGPLDSPNLSKEVAEVVNRCLETDPSRRFSNAQEVKAAFYAAISSEGTEGVAADDHESAFETTGDNIAAPPPGSAPPPPPSAAATGGPVQAPQPARGPVGPGPGPLPVAAAPAMIPVVTPQTQVPNAAPPVANPLLGNPLQVGSGPVSAQSQTVSIQDLLTDTGDATEKWLIQKDRLDFGPFSLGDVKQQLYKGEFTGDDIIVDKETAARSSIRNNAQLVEFIKVLERHQQHEAAAQNEVQASRREKRRRTLMVTVISVSLVLVAGIGFAVWYLVLRKGPETREKIVYRDRPGNLSIKVAFNKEDAAQAKRRRAWKKRRRKRRGKKTGHDDNVTRLGDASSAGGDALLSQQAIQRVMANPRNFNRLTPCVQKQYRRQPSLRKVTIAFGVLGSGAIKYAKVNGQTSGPFQSCIYRQMKGIQFPKYDGALTRASFTMSLGF